MARRQLNVRVAPLIRAQLDELKKDYGMSEGEVVALAIDRLYHGDTRKLDSSLEFCPKCHGELEFVRLEETADSEQLNGTNGVELFFCRYLVRSPIYRCQSCGYAWLLAPHGGWQVLPAVMDHKVISSG